MLIPLSSVHKVGGWIWVLLAELTLDVLYHARLAGAGRQAVTPAQQPQNRAIGVPILGVRGQRLDSVDATPSASVRPQNSTDSGVHVVLHEDHSWKAYIIIICTIAVAIELLMVVLIIVHWRRIRWSLRKISCPCDEDRRSGGRESTRDGEREGEMEGMNVTMHPDEPQPSTSGQPPVNSTPQEQVSQV